MQAQDFDYQKEQPRLGDIAWELFEHTSLRSEELSVNLSLQFFCYCNFSSLALRTTLLLSCGAALTVITFNCT